MQLVLVLYCTILLYCVYFAAGGGKLQHLHGLPIAMLDDLGRTGIISDDISHVQAQPAQF